MLSSSKNESVCPLRCSSSLSKRLTSNTYCPDLRPTSAANLEIQLKNWPQEMGRVTSYQYPHPETRYPMIAQIKVSTISWQGCWDHREKRLRCRLLIWIATCIRVWGSLRNIVKLWSNSKSADPPKCLTPSMKCLNSVRNLMLNSQSSLKQPF